jgi:ABC-type enterochelin transport system permease subunit
VPAIRLAAAAVGLAAIVLVSAWLFRWPLAKAALLAPVSVATVGATAFILVLWTKIAYEALRAQRHPLRIVAAGLAGLALLVVLSFFVDLPATH